MDTNNITESFNNVLRQRYLPLRHDTTIFALVQVLVEIVFPEQEIRYMQAVIKQTSAYRRPRYDIPFYLQDRPHSVQSLCLLNLERGRKIPKSSLTQLPTEGKFSKSVSKSESNEKWNIDICGGTCTCPSFLSSKIPCKHMFAVFHHFPQWTWKSLPKTLTNAPHMTLSCSHPLVSSHTQTLHSDDNELYIHVDDTGEDSVTPTVTQPIPTKTTDGAQVYRLQKQVEELLGRCRTLAFLTNEIPVLTKALSQCHTVMETLASSATDSSATHLPPIFHSISQAGVKEFKSTTKTLLRIGMKRKRSGQGNKNQKHRKLSAPSESGVNLKVNQGPGRPKIKKTQRKKTPLPRQVSKFNRAKLMKAAAVLRKGEHYK